MFNKASSYLQILPNIPGDKNIGIFPNKISDFPDIPIFAGDP